ncbi:NTP transferase domain-containing protein [Roseomonas sp. BN140053]|uniref:phosphocholine cytidylyltransferase family protein n=1 Tax=Roseomonas sp. BN140053 TaxID=3391898 RepID=UPI0039EB2C98
MHAVILSAGQGKRLLPHTAERPKCLLPLAGRSILEWQLRALAAAGVSGATVVTGFAAGLVEAEAATLAGPLGLTVGTRFNPFFAVADNLGSCFMARDLLRGDVLLLNGDTVFEPEVPRRVLAAPDAPVAVTIDRKSAYDEDDMKVSLSGERVTAIGKTLSATATQAESIGLLRFNAEGSAAFVAGAEAALRRPDGLHRWYLSVVDALAGQGLVRANSIEGLGWSEVDFPQDIPRATRLAEGWIGGTT